MMEIRQLRCFVTCVEAGSFTAAAELLYTTQSSVSKTIHAMEHELQTELFERTGRGIRLTAGDRSFITMRSTCWILWSRSSSWPGKVRYAV